VGVGDGADQKTFADALRRQLDTTGLTDGEYRRLILAELLTQKLKDNLKLQLPLSATQAKVEVIATNTEADANAAIQRVKAGEDWATVAKDMSAEVDVQTTGGLHDYAPQGSFNPAYDDYVFSATIGDVSPPLSASSGQFFVVRVDDRADRPVTDDQKPRMTEKAYSDWLSSQQDQLSVKRDFDTQAEQDALRSVITDAGPRLQQQAPQQLPAQQQPQQEAPMNPQAPSGDQQAPVAPAPGGGNGQ
jgi:parvulin-like peptidyl-prolyl isomerase